MSNMDKIVKWIIQGKPPPPGGYSSTEVTGVLVGKFREHL